MDTRLLDFYASAFITRKVNFHLLDLSFCLFGVYELTLLGRYIGYDVRAMPQTRKEGSDDLNFATIYLFLQ